MKIYPCSHLLSILIDEWLLSIRHCRFGYTRYLLRQAVESFVAGFDNINNTLLQESKLVQGAVNLFGNGVGNVANLAVLGKLGTFLCKHIVKML